MAQPRGNAAEFVEQHVNLLMQTAYLHDDVNALLEQPVETLTNDTICYTMEIFTDRAQYSFKLGSNDRYLSYDELAMN